MFEIFRLEAIFTSACKVSWKLWARQVVLSATAPPRKTSNFGWLNMQHISPPFHGYQHKSIPVLKIKNTDFFKTETMNKTTTWSLAWGRCKTEVKHFLSFLGYFEHETKKLLNFSPFLRPRSRMRLTKLNYSLLPQVGGWTEARIFSPCLCHFNLF